MALDADRKTFVVYIAMKKQDDMPVHFERQVQIKMEAYIDIQG